MNAMNVPPSIYPVTRIIRPIDFDPYDGAYSLALSDIDYRFFTVSRLGTSSAPDRSIETAQSIGSPWRIRTSSDTIDRAFDVPAASPQAALDAPGQIADLKRVTGLGWEKIAELLGCSRQAVHRWTLGEAITNANRERLARLHATIRFIDRGNADANRELLNTSFDGRVLIELLEEGRFEDVRSLAGRGNDRAGATWGKPDRGESIADHWFSRLSEGEDAGSVVRAKPQALKRLHLKRG